MTAHPSDLFRPEVIEARHLRLEGEVILAQPVRSNLITAFIVAIIAALATWIVFGTYTRSEVARGLLVTDVPTTKILAIRPGRIAELRVRDGDRVRAGQKIATIMVEQPEESGASLSAESMGALDTQRALAQQQAALATVRASEERMRLTAALAGLRQQRSSVAAQVQLQEQVVESAKETFERIAPVMEKGFVSRIELEARRQAWLNAQQQLAQLKQQAAGLVAEEAKTRAELGRAGTDAATEITSAESAAAGFEGQRAQTLAQRAYVIVAPVNGRVTALQAAAGRTVDASAPLMEIVPNNSLLHAEIYAPSRAVGFVKPGQEVRLLYDAFPYQHFGSFGGRVTDISRTVLDPREIAAPIKIEEPVYRIEVALDRRWVETFGSRLQLQPGMTLSANLILERRSFADWLLQPLEAVTRRSR